MPLWVISQILRKLIMSKRHVAAVIGAATSGAEIAGQLASQGVEVVVLEQNKSPYGKIEEGLPRWHKKLREKQAEKINSKLDQPLVHFIPDAKLDRDFSIQKLASLGFSVIVLANGAQLDRALAVDGVKAVADDSFVYQNDFLAWFNHYEFAEYKGRHIEVPGGVVVIGGGLASIDVAKICQLEVTKRALSERGIEMSINEIEHMGIVKALAKHDLSWESLGLKPARLYYRKRKEDMSLYPLPPNPTAEQTEKAHRVRLKLINNATAKFLFEVYPFHVSKSLKVENGKVKGIYFDVKEGGETREEYVPCDMVVSSIGSIPAPLKDISRDGELYQIESKDTGKLKDFDNLFAVGNVVTGKGNIQASMKHSQKIGKIIAETLASSSPDYELIFSASEEIAGNHAREIFDFLTSCPHIEDATYKQIMEFKNQLQSKVQYQGDFLSYVRKYTSIEV